MNNAIKTGRIVCFGELLLRLSAPGKELPFSHRGSTRTSVAPRRMSPPRWPSSAIRAAWSARYPDNLIGRACAGELRRHGVDTSGIHFAAGRMGLYFLAPRRDAACGPGDLRPRGFGIRAHFRPLRTTGHSCCTVPAGCTCPASTSHWAMSRPRRRCMRCRLHARRESPYRSTAITAAISGVRAPRRQRNCCAK